MKNNYAELFLTENNELIFDCSYEAGLVAAFKAKIPTSGRKQHREGGKFQYWLIAPEYGEICADLVERFFGFRPDVPKIEEGAQKQTKLIKLMYLGSAKPQPNGDRVARGHDGDGWNFIFPERVLREYFGMPLDPSEAATHYGVLGVQETATQDEIKKAYRRACFAWHPDHNKSPDASEQFRVVQAAYDVLSDERKRARYDSAPFVPDVGVDVENWKSPLNCGMLVVEGVEMLGRFNVSKIITWQDIYNDAGQVMAVYWGYDRDADKFDDSYTVEWM